MMGKQTQMVTLDIDSMIPQNHLLRKSNENVNLISCMIKHLLITWQREENILFL